MKTLPQGIITSLIIPFGDDGSIDWNILREEVLALDKPEIAGLCVGGLLSGTIGGEAEETDALCSAVRAASSKPLFAMIYPDTELEALEMGRAAREGGADALLVAPPHYLSQPTELGLRGAFTALRKELRCAVLLADCFPHAAVEASVIGNLASEGVIDGVFEAANAHTLIDLLLLPSAPPIYSGIEDLHYIFFMLGVHGIVSDLSAVFPEEIAAIHRAYSSADHAQARLQQDRMVRAWHVLNHASERQARLRSAFEARGFPVGLPRSPYGHLDEDARRSVAEMCKREGLA